MILHIKDSDTGESQLDVVPVPEGFSFQMHGHPDLVAGDYVSVIVNPAQAAKLIKYLMGGSTAL